MFSERSFRDQLTTATDAGTLYRLFSNWEAAS
jgi:hypothetical protein